MGPFTPKLHFPDLTVSVLVKLVQPIRQLFQAISWEEKRDLKAVLSISEFDNDPVNYRRNQNLIRRVRYDDRTK